MKRTPLIGDRAVGVGLAGVVALGAFAGCVKRPGVSQRASYESVQQARDAAALRKGPIVLEWNPRSFPDRVDKIRPMGAEGSGTDAVIPTGEGLSTRVHELLDAAVGVSSSSDARLTIEVREAKTDYRYSIGMITDRHIDAARGTLGVAFTYGDLRWEKRLVAQAAEADSGKQGTVLIEDVWDELALGVTASVLANLPERPAGMPSTVTAPPGAPVGAPASEGRPVEPVREATPAASVREVVTSAPDDATLSEELEALKRVLLKKGLITEQEWEEIVEEIIAEREAR